MALRGTMTMLLAATALGLAVPAAAQDADYAQSYPTAGYDTDGQSVDSIAVFFEPLSHYGRWLDSRYGRVWQPNVPQGWRPYTIGHWEEGPYGQTWRSDEPFGWAVFHFGRWAYDPQLGWVWSPDTVWGPGWVAWRDGDDVAGWAPLPPQINLFYGGDYAFNDWGYDQWYQPGWVYVPRGYLYTRSLRGAYLPFARNRDLWERTRGVTRYDRVDGQVVNRSFAPRGDARASGYGYGRDLHAYGGVRGYAPAQPYAAPRGYVPTQPFVPPPGGARGYGYVPGTPRGFDRRAVAPPGMPPGGVVPGRPAGTFAPPPGMRSMPMPAPHAAPPPRPQPAPRERPR